MYIPQFKFTLSDVEVNITMLSQISKSFQTDTTLLIFRWEDLIVIRIDLWCISEKYNLMLYTCGSSVLKSFKLSMLSKTSIHQWFSLAESHYLITATVWSIFCNSAVIFRRAEDEFSSCKHLTMTAKLCFNVSLFLLFSQKMIK